MLHAVIMAGGSGTRFWPKSRRNRPKQLLRLQGERTMLQQTLDRISPLVPTERCWIITGADQAEVTREQVPDLASHHIVGEPCARDTAACVGLAAALVSAEDPDATMVVMPADHVIEPAEVFRRTVVAAAEVVEDDPSALVTFGVKPTRPETGYGYIECGEAEPSRDGIAVNRVARFREKPDRAQAEEFLSTGRFVWNAGIFVWKAATVLEALRTFRPELGAGIDRIATAIGEGRGAEAIEREYPGLERVPIDKAVMEKAPNVKVLEVRYDWSDVGDWRALASLIRADESGNAIEGPVVAVETRDSLVVADEGKLICLLGVEGLVVVQSGGATLVSRKDQLDKLKGVVEGLAKAGYPEVL